DASLLHSIGARVFPLAGRGPRCADSLFGAQEFCMHWSHRWCLHVAGVLLATALVAPLARAATWDIDPAHSEVGFKVKHLGVSNVRGEFLKFSGTVVIDEKDPSKSRVEVSIDPASIDTGVAKRDEHLRS